jgi:hypothetical protein
MRIHQLLDHGVILTNEENEFIRTHADKIEINQLNDRPRLIAHNLVRKGVYQISNDNKHLLKQHDKDRS